MFRNLMLLFEQVYYIKLMIIIYCFLKYSPRVVRCFAQKCNEISLIFLFDHILFSQRQHQSIESRRAEVCMVSYYMTLHTFFISYVCRLKDLAGFRIGEDN